MTQARYSGNNGARQMMVERAPTEREDTAPEIALWAAVLAQAIKDACLGELTAKGRKQKLRQELNRAEARAWLLRGGREFQIVCGGAGYDPERIRPALARLAAAGWPPSAVSTEGRMPL